MEKLRSFLTAVDIDFIRTLTFGLEGVRYGPGLATLPCFSADDEIEAGKLVELLADWEVEALEVFAVCPPNAPRESLTRRLLDFPSETVEFKPRHRTRRRP